MKLARWSVATLLVLLPACAVDVQDQAGPRVPIPNVLGDVARAGSPAPGLGVKLRTQAGVEVASATTSRTGSFDFADVLPGTWEIKVSSAEPGDFDAVTLAFRLGSDSTPLTLPTLDLHAYGAQAIEPVPDDTVPDPSKHLPLIFRWTLPDRPGTEARIQIFDSSGEPVWISARLAADQVAWDGVSNQGSQQGRAVGPGAFAWRVKFSLPDSTEGRLAERRLVLT